MWLLLTDCETHPGKGFSRLHRYAEALHLAADISGKTTAEFLGRAERGRC